MNRMNRTAGAAVAAVVLVLVTLVVIAALPHEPATPGSGGTPGASATAVALASLAPPTTTSPSKTPAPTAAPDSTPTGVPQPTPTQAPTASPAATPPPVTPTVVYFESWGSGHHRLYRWALDGVTKPEFLLDRPVPIGDAGGAETYSVSPDGSIALAVSTSSPRSVTAFDLASGREIWSETTERSMDVHLWSTDSALALVLERDDEDVATWQRLDIATGARSAIAFPEDWELLGFERGTHSIVLSDIGNGRALGRRFLVIDAETGAQREVGPGEVDLGTASSTLRVSTLLGAYVEVSRPGDGVRAVSVTNAATGEVTTVEIPGAMDAGFDPTGGHVLIWTGEGTDENPRAALYDWQPGTDPVRTWDGEGSAFQEPSFSVDGSALIFRGNWRVPAFSFVDLAVGATAAIPLPVDVHMASPVAVIKGTEAPELASAPFPEPQIDPAPGRELPGTPLAITGAVMGTLPTLRLELTAFAATDSGSALPFATASLQLAQTTSTEVSWRVVREDAGGRLTIWVSALQGCCTLSGRLWSWSPGSEPRREPFPARMRPAYGVGISPDGRWVAGTNGRSLLVWNRTTGTVTSSRVALDGGTIDGWTADGRSLVLYRGYGIEGQCLTGGTVALLDLRTHQSRPYRGEALRTASGAIYAPWGAANVFEKRNGRSFWAGDYCADEQESVRLPSGLRIDQVVWDEGGGSAFILARDAKNRRHLLHYVVGRNGLERTPQRLALGDVPWDQIASIETVVARSRWAVVHGEGRYAAVRSGLVNLRTGTIAWLPAGSEIAYAYAPPG